MPFDENKIEPITSLNTPNETTFHPVECTEPSASWAKEGLLTNRNYHRKQDEYADLKWLDAGRGDRRKTGDDESLKQMMDRTNRFDAIASQLGFTHYQKSTGRNLRDSQSLRNMGCKDECTSFCLCVFIARYGAYARRTAEDSEWSPEGPNCISEGSRKVYHPTRSAENNDERFVRLAENIGLNEEKIAKVMGRMADKLPSNLTWHNS